MPDNLPRDFAELMVFVTGELGIVPVWVPAWHPPSLNRFAGAHWTRLDRAKRSAADVIGVYFRQAGGRPVTSTYRPRRRISLILSGALNKPPDPDNLLKVFLDACVRAAVLVDDAPEWCEWTPPLIVKNGEYGTGFGVRDLGDGPPGDDPHTRRLKAAMTRKANRGRT